eukprot:1498977-Prymnesium_polylepis.1
MLPGKHPRNVPISRLHDLEAGALLAHDGCVLRVAAACPPPRRRRGRAVSAASTRAAASAPPAAPPARSR